MSRVPRTLKRFEFLQWLYIEEPLYLRRGRVCLWSVRSSLFVRYSPVSLSHMVFRASFHSMSFQVPVVSVSLHIVVYFIWKNPSSMLSVVETTATDACPLPASAARRYQSTRERAGSNAFSPLEHINQAKHSLPLFQTH